MIHGEFLYNSSYDKTMRGLGVRSYFLTYGLVFLIAYLLDFPLLFQIPLTSHFITLTAASSWAFVVSYPAFHMLMKSRVLINYRRAIYKIYAALIGIFLIAFIVFFFSLELPVDAATRAGRSLRNSHLFAGLLLASASMTISMGIFAVLEPLRERIARGL